MLTIVESINFMKRQKNVLETNLTAGGLVGGKIIDRN